MSALITALVSIVLTAAHKTLSATGLKFRNVTSRALTRHDNEVHERSMDAELPASWSFGLLVSPCWHDPVGESEHSYDAGHVHQQGRIREASKFH